MYFASFVICFHQIEELSSKQEIDEKELSVLQDEINALKVRRFSGFLAVDASTVS